MNSSSKDIDRSLEKKGKIKKRKRSLGASKSDKYPLKKPLYAYSVFMNERREEMSKNCPNLTFNEITNLLGTKWSELGMKEKRPYIMKAEKEKLDYIEKLKTMEKNEDAETTEEKPNNTSKIEFNVPIFTDEFLDYNKSKETELRNLRKTCAQFKEQNVILSRHVDELKSAVGKLDTETKAQRESNDKSEKTLKKLRENLVRSFINVQLPETGMRPTLDNIDKYMKNVYMFLERDPNKYPGFAHEVRAVMRMVDIAEI